MYQFFTENEQICDGRIRITGSDVNHIKNVLRMRPGEQVRVSCPSGSSFFCHVEEITADCVSLAVDRPDHDGTEFAHKVFLFQGLAKGDKMEFVIQKAVELGVYALIPVAMKNCVVQLDERKAKERTKRWQAIAESAAKQSGRSLIPEVHTPVSWREALALAEELADLVLVPYENERGLMHTREVIGGIAEGAPVAVMIGPEGGFAPEEIESVREREHCRLISLGRRILRTETAGPATLAMLVYALDD